MVVFVGPESTPEDSHAAHLPKMSGFINEITESELNCMDWRVQVSKARRQKNHDAPSASFLFLMELEIQGKLLVQTYLNEKSTAGF